MGEQGAQREQSGQARSNPMLGWLIAVIGLLIAVILGWAMMAIGAGRLEAAKKTRSDAEGRLLIALDYAAREAMREAQGAQVAINKNNLGEAAARLSRANDLVTLMEQVAPESMRSEVNDVRNSLSEAQQQVGARSQDAAQTLNTLITQLDGLTAKREGA